VSVLESGTASELDEEMVLEQVVWGVVVLVDLEQVSQK